MTCLGLWTCAELDGLRWFASVVALLELLVYGLSHLEVCLLEREVLGSSMEDAFRFCQGGSGLYAQFFVLVAP